MITLLERLKHNLNSVINENSQAEEKNDIVERVSALLDRVETSLHSMISKNDKRNNKEEKFKCKKCGKHFADNNEFNLHTLRSKECENILESQSLNCNECNFHTKSLKNLNIHSLQHFEELNLENKDIFLCPESGCGYKGYSMKNYRSHYYLHTDKYQCNICNHRFVRRIDLVNHLRKMHDVYRDFNSEEEKEAPPKTFTCTEYGCAYKGSTLKNLKGHSVVHTDKHLCDGCNQRFVRRVDLVKHMKKKHFLP